MKTKLITTLIILTISLSSYSQTTYTSGTWGSSTTTIIGNTATTTTQVFGAPGTLPTTYYSTTYYSGFNNYSECNGKGWSRTTKQERRQFRVNMGILTVSFAVFALYVFTL